ncbi:efflux transporter outer membrane subunit [Aquirhabdus sp.]|uniref:efflux transporter outer membrane subunit n=1 Tax=Aquirhabdus sp. TaxID=2824160 RepID=UPI00396CF1DC
MNPHLSELATIRVKTKSPLLRQRYGSTLFARTALVFSVMLLTACVHNTPPDLTQHLPEHWQHQISEAKLPEPDLHAWWKSFHAPDLDALIDQSLKQNLTLAAAREHIRAARILTENSPNKFLPDLHLRTDDLPSPSATTSYFRAGVDSTWELGLFGKRSATQQIAQGELLSVEAQTQMAQVSLVAEVVRTWVALRTAQQQVLLLNQMIDQTQQQISLGEQRLQLGLSSSNALLALRSSQSRQIKLRLEKQFEIDQAIEQLALLQGRDTRDQTLLTPTVLPVITDFSIDSIPADLIRIRPDIQQAQASVLQAAGQLGVAKAQRYPSISIAGSYMYSVQLLGKLSFHNTSVHGVGSFGPEIDIPLFDWGQRKAKADAQGAELNAAVYSYRETVLEAVHEVESSIAGVNAQRQRTLEQLKMTHTALQALTARQSLTSLGLASKLDMMDDQQSLLQTQFELAEIHKDHDLAYIAMYKALGGAPINDSDLPSNDSKNLNKSAPSSFSRLGG